MSAMKTSEFLDALCLALQRQAGSLNLSDSPKTIKEWDSIGHLTIMATVSAKLGVAPDSDDLRDFASIGDLVGALHKRGNLEHDL